MKIKLLLIPVFFLLAACGPNDQIDPETPGTPDTPAPATDFSEEEVEPVPPELLEPQDQATVFEEKPLLSWEEVPGRGMYVVEIHQYEDMRAPAWSDYVNETEWRISEEFSGLEHDGTYFWRVRRGMSNWSEVRSLTVDLERD